MGLDNIKKSFISCAMNVAFLSVFMIKRKLYNHSMIDDNLVVFHSIPSFADNPRTLYERLLKREDLKKLKFVWLVDEGFTVKAEHQNPRTEFIVLKTKQHVGNTLKSLDVVSRAKYIFFDHITPFWRIKAKPEQIVVNLWHGCGYKDTSKGQPKDKWFDYALVPGPLFIETKKKSWNYEGCQILDLGYPRYDELLIGCEGADGFVKSIKKNNKFFLMWMPTFRKTGKEEYPEETVERVFDFPLFNTIEEIHKVDDFCSENGVMICIKRHPFQTSYRCEDEKFSNICFIDQVKLDEQGISLYEMLHYADGLISDYSSVSVDFMLLNRPIAYTLDDFNSYKSSRGFVFENPLEYMPGNHLYNIEDLTEFLNQLAKGLDPFFEKRQELLPIMHNQTSNYCDRIIQYFWECD